MTGIAFRPTKTERAAVTNILNRDDYTDADAMADAILKAAWAAFLARPWWLTIVGNPAKPACWGYGLASTRAAAERASGGLPARVVQVTSPPDGGVVLRDAEVFTIREVVDALRDRAADLFGWAEGGPGVDVLSAEREARAFSLVAAFVEAEFLDRKET